MRHTTYGSGSTLKLLSSWEELGAVLQVKINHMAYARVSRKKLQKPIRLKKRLVYASASPLSIIQKRLTNIFNQLLDERPHNEVAIAYRPGVNVVECISEYAGSAVLVKTDIRKYYDNISFAHIVHTLGECGMQSRGARLVAGYCIVSDAERGFSCLQQGSACSPALANLVGNLYFDVPILAWLKENCLVEHQYYRYSDNLVLFCKDEPGQEFTDAYKAKVNEIVKKGRFSTHSWSTIRNNHPERHQEFLGIVLNEVATLPRERRDWLRAVLWNAITGDISGEALRYFDRVGGLPRSLNSYVVREKFFCALQGHVAYASMVGGKFAVMVEKLFGILRYLKEADRNFPLDSRAYNALKRYRNNSESVEDYCNKVITVIERT